MPYQALFVVNAEGERVLDSQSFVFSVGLSQGDERSIELTGEQPILLHINL